MPQSTYDPEPYLRTGVNLTAFTWLFILGIPALILFLIYAKLDDRAHQPIPQASHIAQQADRMPRHP